MPLSWVGLDELNQNAFAYGSAIPHLQVEWTTSDPHTASLESPFWTNGMAPNPNNNGAMRLIAKFYGQVTIKLSVKITAPIDLIGQAQLDRDIEFTDEIEVIIFQDVNDWTIGRNSLVMAPFSEMELYSKMIGKI